MSHAGNLLGTISLLFFFCAVLCVAISYEQLSVCGVSASSLRSVINLSLMRHQLVLVEQGHVECYNMNQSVQRNKRSGERSKQLNCPACSVG